MERDGAFCGFPEFSYRRLNFYPVGSEKKRPETVSIEARLAQAQQPSHTLAQKSHF